MKTRNSLLQLSTLIPAIVMWSTFPAHGAEATMVGVYENCQFMTGSVFVEGDDLSAEEKASASAAVESALIRYGFDGALPYASRALKRYGIQTIKIKRQGFDGCGNITSGKFVQAIGNYCGDRLVSAEIRVDGKVMVKKTGGLSSFEAFVDESLIELRRQGIWDRPRVEVNSEGTCEPVGPANQG
jgi:hypothetical protein